MFVNNKTKQFFKKNNPQMSHNNVTLRDKKISELPKILLLRKL